uniref:Putative secreted protein n=1 Tax=Ixodes ricinus TaxID=34613 RepID=A0A6B0UGL4_IXORI
MHCNAARPLWILSPRSTQKLRLLLGCALSGPCHGCTKMYRHVHGVCMCGLSGFRSRALPALRRTRAERVLEGGLQEQPPDIWAAAPSPTSSSLAVCFASGDVSAP